MRKLRLLSTVARFLGTSALPALQQGSLVMWAHTNNQRSVDPRGFLAAKMATNYPEVAGINCRRPLAGLSGVPWLILQDTRIESNRSNFKLNLPIGQKWKVEEPVLEWKGH